MVITIPVPSPAPAMIEGAFEALSHRLRLRLADFLRLLETADLSTTPEWRADQRGMTPLAWTGRIRQKVESRSFQPLSVAMEAAFALLRRFDLSVGQIGAALEQAGALDTLAIGPDLSRDDPAWAALIASEARNWYHDASFADAMVEVVVWSFRAWAMTLPNPAGPVIELGRGR